MKMVEVQKGSNWCVAYFSDMENSEISDFRIFIFLVILIIKLFKKICLFYRNSYFVCNTGKQRKTRKTRVKIRKISGKIFNNFKLKKIYSPKRGNFANEEIRIKLKIIFLN